MTSPTRGAWYATVDVADRDALTDVPLDLGGEDVVVHAWPEDREWLDRVVDRRRGQRARPRGRHRAALAGRPRARDHRGVVGADRGLCRAVRLGHRRDPDQRGPRRADHRPRGGARLVQRRAVRPALDQRGPGRRVRVARDRGRGPDGRPAGHGLRRPTRRPSASTTGRRRPAIDATTTASETTATTLRGPSSRSIVDDVGEAKMHDVFAAAAAHTVTYIGSGPAETSAPAVADWRRFLDLVEDVGGSTKAAEAHRDVGRDRRPASRSSTARATARQRYDALVAAGRAGCRASSSASR